MTMNKVQGQSSKVAGVDLWIDCFLYVAWKKTNSSSLEARTVKQSVMVGTGVVQGEGGWPPSYLGNVIRPVSCYSNTSRMRSLCQEVEDEITHCVRPEDTVARRAVIILRRVLPTAPRLGCDEDVLSSVANDSDINGLSRPEDNKRRGRKRSVAIQAYEDMPKRARADSYNTEPDQTSPLSDPDEKRANRYIQKKAALTEKKRPTQEGQLVQYLCPWVGWRPSDKAGSLKHS
ncbi:RNA demethylase alkbh5 [Homalodisca vitripennis]|nr:RNA demethylase alkbh5 [Homalodisca vitripennis]